MNGIALPITQNQSNLCQYIQQKYSTDLEGKQKCQAYKFHRNPEDDYDPVHASCQLCCMSENEIDEILHEIHEDTTETADTYRTQNDNAYE